MLWSCLSGQQMTSFTRLFISVLTCLHPGELSYPYSVNEAQINCVSSIAWEVFACAKYVTLPSSSQAL